MDGKSEYWSVKKLAMGHGIDHSIARDRTFDGLWTPRDGSEDPRRPRTCIEKSVFQSS